MKGYFMKVNSNSKHIKNRIYKQFQDSIYDKAPVPAGYDLLFDYDNHESGFVGKVYIKGNHIVVVTKGTDVPSWTDWKNDFAVTLKKHVPQQFYDYLDIYKKIQNVKKIVSDVKTTWLGYSLTGTPAQLIGVLSGDETVCFAPLGAANTIGHLDEIYHNSTELQRLFPDYKGLENADTSNITNYYCEGDSIVTKNPRAQIGDVYVVPTKNILFSHLLYNWDDLSNAVLDERFSSSDNNLPGNDTLLYGNIKKTDYSSDIKNYSSGKYKSPGCPGSYPVKGYTREDGTKVRGYVRDCYKHKGKIPKLDTLPYDELEKWIREFI